ncbi:hypothetical protein EON64_09685, partial [archaeon]
MIRSIDEESIHRLCSSQVVVDLATAVKELVENALDAGATMVEIKLRNYGADSIEVSDNGNGISPEDYANIAERHATSKLETYEGLNEVSSYGFRGEALNALCELSENFQVITRRDCDELGAALNFDKLGRLARQIPSPRGKGTTVVVEKLFTPLPVRRAEFVRNIKKHYQKMLRVIQAYALIATKKKIVLTNFASNGVRTGVLATNYCNRLEDNVSLVFGSAFLATLMPLAVEIEGAVKLSGLLSKAGEGVGRGDSERQFIYLDNRPVDLPPLTRMLNEVFR